MSTRSRILICVDANSAEKGDGLYLYHHCDGYPSGVGSELSKILSQCPLPWNPEGVQKFINEYDDDYEITDYGIHWDDEYYYVINCKERILSGYYKGITNAKESFDLSTWGSDELLIPNNLFSRERKPDSEIVKWEYKIIKTDGKNSEELQNKFNELGAKGWELVSKYEWLAYFKRKI